MFGQYSIISTRLAQYSRIEISCIDNGDDEEEEDDDDDSDDWLIAVMVIEGGSGGWKQRWKQ